ncbi:MAG: hypothetical protein AAF689_12270 [Pseudomonadota bacterium]
MRSLHSFLRETRGAVAFEAVIITPILAWCFVGSFIFFDAFRTYSTSLKATYAVADVISRQELTIYGSDIQGMADIFSHLTRNVSGSSMRVSEISWNGTEYDVEWSHPTGTLTRMRDTDLPGIVDQLPIMASGERVVLVETFIPYDPYFDVGLNNIEFTNFTITRPRFAGQIPFDDGTNPLCSVCNHDDGVTGDGSGTDDLDEPFSG